MEATLEAQARETFGKNEARRTRREGRVPAVVYGAVTTGAGREATAVAIDPKWTPLTDPDTMLVHVIMPKAEEVAAPVEGAVAAPTVAAEPEVIKKGKKDEEEDKK